MRNRWNSSTSPALIAWAARPGPPTLMSRSRRAFICRTASGSKARSIRVLALATVSSVVEYTTLSAARQISRVVAHDGRLVGEATVSQTTITSYIRRPKR